MIQDNLGKFFIFYNCVDCDGPYTDILSAEGDAKAAVTQGRPSAIILKAVKIVERNVTVTTISSPESEL